MYNKGEIVIINNLEFKDGAKDCKNNRPCIILYSSENHVCICPLTSSIKGFNRRPSNYYFIPEVVYNYHKLSFAKIDNIIIRDITECQSANILVNESVVNNIIEKCINNKYLNSKKINIVLEYLYHLENNKQKEINKQEKINNKLLKKQIRIQAKRSIV